MPIRYKDSVYATVMSCGREVIERRKLSTDEAAGFLDRYPFDKVANRVIHVHRARLRSVERERVHYTRTG